jgi:DNA polymerase-3 subunit delta
MITTITGVNDLLRHQALEEMVAAFTAEHGDMAVERMDGEETSAPRMREALASFPFLTSRKLVVLREPSKQKAFGEAIADVLGEVAETTDVLIYEPKLDKRSGYYKTLHKQTEYKDFAALDASGLAKWAVDYVQQSDGSLSPTDARLLIDRVGTNQQLIQSELTKLLHYNAAITRETIELLTERVPASTVFELLDAAFAGKTMRAFELYHEQRALRVEPQAMLALIAWQLHILAVVSAGAKRSADDIAKAAKLNPYVVRKSQAITRKLSLARVKIMIADLLALDIQLKTSSIDADEALQLYLIKLGR